MNKDGIIALVSKEARLTKKDATKVASFYMLIFFVL